MMLVISNSKNSTYPYRKKLFKMGFQYQNGKWVKQSFSDSEEKHTERFCKKKRLRFKKYDEKYERSNGYRKTFISNYETKNGMYRCAYCGKKMSQDYMTVDHIISVYKAQNEFSGKLLMKILRAKTVNDVKNLTPACEKCNRKKGRNIEGYLINGLTGRTYKGVVIRKTFKVVLVISIIVTAFFAIRYTFPNEIEAIIDFIKNII